MNIDRDIKFIYFNQYITVLKDPIENHSISKISIEYIQYLSNISKINIDIYYILKYLRKSIKNNQSYQ